MFLKKGVITIDHVTDPYCNKAVISGDIVEIYNYSQYIIGEQRIKRERTGRSMVASDVEKVLNRIECMNRSRTDVRRLICSNVYRYFEKKDKPYIPKFVTFTFKDNVIDQKWANRQFSLFIQRFNTYLGYHKKTFLKYLTVIEFQDGHRREDGVGRGAIHYHTVFFNLRYIKGMNEMQYIEKELWKLGDIEFRAIEHVDNVGAYMAKYMTKDHLDERLKGKKCYFSSRGLLKPEIIKDDEQVRIIQDFQKSKFVTLEKQFYNEHVGNVKYIQYNYKKRETEIDEDFMRFILEREKLAKENSKLEIDKTSFKPFAIHESKKNTFQYELFKPRIRNISNLNSIPTT